MSFFRTNNKDWKEILNLFNTHYLIEESEYDEDEYTIEVTFKKHPKDLVDRYKEKGSVMYMSKEVLEEILTKHYVRKIDWPVLKLPFTVLLEVYNSKLAPLTDEVREQIKKSLSECDNRASFLYVLERYAKTYAMYSPDEQLFIIELSILEHDNIIHSDYNKDWYWGHLNENILKAIREFI